MTAPKQKFPRIYGLACARELVAALRPVTERIIVAGSLRRMKPEVGDVEIIYIPKLVKVPQLAQAEMLSEICTPGLMMNLADQVIAEMEAGGVLARRKTKNGAEVFGPKNKLMLHVASGIPVDLFSATADNWWNYLVCRTGPAESNIRIAAAAQAKGWKWNPYGPGFTSLDSLNQHKVTSESDVFDFVGMACTAPMQR